MNPGEVAESFACGCTDIIITCVVITLASTPAPFGFRGLLPNAPGMPKQLQAATTATKRERGSTTGSPLAPMAGAGGGFTVAGADSAALQSALRCDLYYT